MKIGFIGLGNMGSPMARNLVRAGHEVAVYNRSRAKSEALGRDGARVAESIAEACRDGEAVFTMLSDDAAVEGVVLGAGGVAESLAAGAAHISSSTIGTGLARRLAEEHVRRGHVIVSAPVFGRPDAAESAKLLVVVGGAAEAGERFRPLFEAVGRQTFIAGAEPWQANAWELHDREHARDVWRSGGGAAEGAGRAA